MVYRVSSHVDTWAHLELITCCVHSNIFVLFSLKTIQIRMHMQVQCVVSYERLKTTHVRACLEERLILLLSHADISFVQSRAWAITSQFHAQPWCFHRSLCVHAQSAKTKDCFARTRKFSEKTCADTRFYGIHVWLGSSWMFSSISWFICAFELTVVWAFSQTSALRSFLDFITDARQRRDRKCHLHSVLHLSN